MHSDSVHNVARCVHMRQKLVCSFSSLSRSRADVDDHHRRFDTDERRMVSLPAIIALGAMSNKTSVFSEILFRLSDLSSVIVRSFLLRVYVCVCVVSAMFSVIIFSIVIVITLLSLRCFTTIVGSWTWIWMECGICARVTETEKSSNSSLFILASEDERERSPTFVARC